MDVLEHFRECLEVISVGLGGSSIDVFEELQLSLELGSLPLTVLELVVSVLQFLMAILIFLLGRKDSEERLLQNVGDVDLLLELVQERPDNFLHALLSDEVDGVPILESFFVSESDLILSFHVQRHLGSLVVDDLLLLIQLMLQLLNLLNLLQRDALGSFELDL